MTTRADLDAMEVLKAPAISAELIRQQLERILTSEPFRHSKRHPRFLRFVVGKVLEGTTEEIKERLIGIEVFDRPVDYDASSDPIVRGAAGDIRKRLAQYYLDPARALELRFELQPGSYVPTIYWPVVAMPRAAAKARDNSVHHEIRSTAPAQAPQVEQTKNFPAPVSNAKRMWLMSVAAAILLTGVIAAGIYTSRPERGLTSFWKPMLDSADTIICVGDLNYLMPASAATGNASLEQTMQGQNHLGQTNAAALGKLSSMLGSRDVSNSVLLADVANLTDLRGQPTVLIGAFDNRWTQKILENARFKVVWNSAVRHAQIVDTQNPGNKSWAVDFNSPIRAIIRDYAIVARIASPLTGQTAIAIAGVGPYGTTAACEFVTNPIFFKQFADRAPKGWQNRNVEIVLTTQVVDGRSARPVVVAYDVR